ncbi:MAG: signal peptide peptidase SppA [Paludibacteraceae bacterium]|nr:signal peptide peptidase SppA [Paludibacteraceae bacterium]
MTTNEKKPRRRSGCMTGIIIFIVLYIVSTILSGIWLNNMFSSSVSLDSETVYMLRMKGTVAEQGQEDNPFASFMGDVPGYQQKEVVGLDDLLHNIRIAKTDNRIRGIMLYGGELQMGFATAQTLRNALLDFKESGKFLIAYAPSYSQVNYYVASVADSVYLNPTGTVNWNGLSANKMYFTRLLEKVGVRMQVVKVGSFKSAVEPYIRTDMSEADRQQTMQYVNGLWQELVAGVSQSRSIEEARLNEYADRYMGLQPADSMVACGLVDRLIYSQEMDSILTRLVGTEDYNMIKTSELATVSEKLPSSKNEIAVLYAEGEITDTKGNGIVGLKTVRQLNKIRKNDDVKAVVLRVNSPGGSADASEQIWHAVQLLRESGKPVVVSMGDYAASGGYYISCGADYIYAQPGTLTGSIGIFGLIPDVSQLRNQLGVDIDGLKTNAHSDLEVNAIYRGMNSEENAMMQQMVERGYDLFTRRCADGRHTSQDEIKKIGEGRVWLGKDALTLGLVDELGGMDEAVRKAAELAELDKYELTYYPDRKDFLTQLMEQLDSSSEEEKMISRIRERCSEARVLMLMHFPEIK